MLEERERRDLAARLKATATAPPSSLRDFLRGAWPILVPATPLAQHFALDAICEHLEAVSRGQIRKLIINVPPGMAKSTLTAVIWPAWEWTTQPHLQWMFATYAMQLTYRDARRRRDLMATQWYREQMRVPFEILEDAVVYQKNDKQGYFFSTSTGAQTTGWRCDRQLLDDPQDPQGAESDIQRASTIEWLTRTWPTRLNLGSPHAGQVLIQQRLHELDATGLYLKEGGWAHLKIPLEWKGKVFSTPLGWRDPRTKEGEIISEAIYPRDKVDDLKRTLGPYGVAGQLDQEPAPAEGGIIKVAWLRTWTDHLGACDVGDYRIEPFSALRFCTVDPAVSEKELESQSDPDYTVIAAWCAFLSKRGVILILLDLIRARMEGPDIVPKLHAMHAHWKFSVIGVESIQFQKSLFQQAKREGLPVREMSQKEDAIYRIDKDKVSRAMAATPLMADGRFYVPAYAPWLADFVKELTTFPNAAHDDQVDCVSAAVAIAQKIKAEVQQEPEPVRQRFDDGYIEEEDNGANPYAGWRPASP